MRKLTKKSQLILYGCSGIGVNMLNSIVGSYLCSALLVGGFKEHIESWTYLNTDLVVAALWGTLILILKIIDGVVDVPMASFIDNLRTKWGRRRPALLIGFVPMIIAYVLFLVPLEPQASILNTIWFALLLGIFYLFYTITMLNFYATFSEVTEKESDIVFLSNVKSICDVVYFSLSFALVPIFVSMGINIRIVALLFLPLSLTMMIPLFMIKEPSTKEETGEKKKRITLRQSIGFSLKNKTLLYWMTVAAVMNVGLQLFLGGINEYFSSAGLNMTIVMACAFAPVPFTLPIYNKLVKKKGLAFGFRYILIVFSIGMSLMFLCNVLPQQFLLPLAIVCALMVSFSMGAFFSITYTVPSHLANIESERIGENIASMYFAFQGLFEGAAAGFATGVLLVALKQNGGVPYMTVIVAAFCMLAFVMSFFLPKTVALMGKDGNNEE